MKNAIHFACIAASSASLSWRILVAACTLSVTAIVSAQSASSTLELAPRFDDPPARTPQLQAAPTKAERKAQRQFDMVDANHDGKISREEAQALPQLAAAFSTLDTDHNGFITMAEIRQFALLHRSELQRRRKESAPTPPVH